MINLTSEVGTKVIRNVTYNVNTKTIQSNLNHCYNVKCVCTTI